MSTQLLFIGREKERELFKQKLKNPYGEDRVQYISGPGGIGKTWLLRAMLSDARRWPSPRFRVVEALIDTYSTGNRHVEGIIAAIITQMNLQPDNLKKYHREKALLDAARRQEGYAQSGLEAQLNALAKAFRDDLQQFVAEQPVVVAFDTFEHVMQNPVGRWVLSIDGLQMPGLVCIVAGRDLLGQPPLDKISDAEALNLYQKYSPRLIGDWGTEDADYAAHLNKLSQGNPLLIGLALHWLDTTDLDDETLATLDFADFQRRIASWLSPTDTRAGLLFSGYVADELNEPLRQLLVCMAYLNRRFNQTLLNRLVQAHYVRGAAADQLWQILTGDNLPDFFYVKGRPEGEIQLHDKLAEMLRLNVLPNAFDDMTRQRVRQFAADVVDWYDDLIAQTANNQQKAILQAEKLAYALRRDVLADIQQPEWLGMPEAKMLGQLLPPDFEQVRDLVLTYQRQRSDVLNRLVVNEVRPEIAAQIPLTWCYAICAALGEMAKDVYLLSESAQYWQLAAAAAKTTQDIPQQIRALRWQSNSTWQNDVPGALSLVQQALDLCDKAESLRPEILYSMGFIHRQRQDLEEAVRWYEAALESVQQHDPEQLILPTILNDMGYARLLIGQYGKAKVQIEKAAKIRERNRDRAKARLDQLQAQMAQPSNSDSHRWLQRAVIQSDAAWRDARLKLGMTYSTLGQLARQNAIDLAEATGFYAEALEIFKQLGDYYWQATVLQARGDSHRRLAMSLYYKERLESSHRYDQMAEEDIKASLDLCRRYGFVDLLPIVERRMGRLLHDRALTVATDPQQQIVLMKDALAHFLAGAQAAQKSRQTQEELENGVQIAFLADDLIRAYRRRNLSGELTSKEEKEVKGYLDQLEQRIHRHENDDPRIYQFEVFRDLLEIERGAYQYEMGAYEQAFSHYLKGYTGLASDPGYGSACCRTYFDHLSGNIARLPDVEMKKRWYEGFVEAWRSAKMRRNGGKTIADAHPDLIERLELDLLIE